MASRWVTEQSNKLADLAEKRNKKFKAVLTSDFPPLKSMQTKVIFGAYSWTMPYLQERYLDKNETVNLYGWEQTPTEVARDYLRITFPKRLRATASQAEILKQQRSHVLYAKPARIPDAAYVDLKAAFWSIMNAVGWDVDYYPNEFIAKGRSVEDFPLPNHKPARNSLVSMGLPSISRVWTGSVFQSEATNNPNLNLGIWRLVQDVLHTIAHRAVKMGACYVHTDGYILPRQRADALRSYISDWGLQSSIKHTGEAKIYAAGVYSIGDHAPQRTVSGYTPHAYILPADEAWLMPRFAKLTTVKLDLLDTFNLV